jgi:hypothetical protein
MKKPFAASAILGAVLLSACAATGPSSTSARPVFYPNATLNRGGDAQAQRESDQCMGSARSAGLTPDEKNNAVGQGASRGAAVGGIAATVGALVRGRPDRALGAAAAGVAVGGSAGAVNGAFQEKPSATFRNFVQRCLKDKGYDVIGWN